MGRHGTENGRYTRDKEMSDKKKALEQWGDGRHKEKLTTLWLFWFKTKQQTKAGTATTRPGDTQIPKGRLTT
jgi:hypothetical protein